MSKLQVYFGDPEHGWIDFVVLGNDSQVLQHDVSDIYPSFDELVAALSAMLDTNAKQIVTWALEPSELELNFSRSSSANEIQLDITLFESFQSPRGNRQPELTFIGSYAEICLPFWRALRELQSRCFNEKLEEDWRWTNEFPTRELALLTARIKAD